MQSEKEQVALTSIVASAALTIAKGVVGIATGSLAILSEAGHSLIDLGATVMTYAAVRMSGKPADEEHQYGHGKVESVSALGETALLFLLSGVVIWEAVKRLIEHEEHTVVANVWAFGVIAVSIAVDFFRARALSRTAKATAKPGAGSRRAAFFVRPVGVARRADWPRRRAFRPALGGFGRRAGGGVLVCVAGWRLGRRTIDTLTDTAPEGAADEDHGDCGESAGRGLRSSRCARAPSAKRPSSIWPSPSAAPCRSTA